MTRERFTIEFHPGFQIDAKDIIGEINVEQYSVNLVGEQTAYYWESKGVGDAKRLRLTHAPAAL